MHLTASSLGECQIVLSTLFFGLSFIGMRVAATKMDDLGPVSFQTCRCFMSLVLISLARKKMKKILHTDVVNTDQEENHLIDQLKLSLPTGCMSNYTFDLLFFGTGCGILTFLISVCQQVGLETLTAGKASFVNGLFVVITPVIEHFLPCYKKPIPSVTWLAIVLSVFGMYYLAYPHGVEEETGTSAVVFPIGVLWLLLSTFFTSVDIMFSDAGAKRVDTIDFTLVMFGSSAIIALLVALVVEPTDWVWPMMALQNCWMIVVFVGVTEGFGYTFGSIGQMYVPCHRASLLYGLEGVWTCIMGFIFLGEELTFRELFGCFLLLTGTMVSVSPEMYNNDDKDNDNIIHTEEDNNVNSSLHLLHQQQHHNTSSNNNCNTALLQKDSTVDKKVILLSDSSRSGAPSNYGAMI